MMIQSTARILIVAVAGLYCLPAPAQSTDTQNTIQPSPQPSSQPTQNQQGQGSSAGATVGSPAVQPASAADQPATAQPPSSQPARGNGATSTAPQTQQQPVTTYPDAAGAVQSTAPGQESQTPPDAPQPKAQQNAQQQTEPQGAATAEKVNTAGGAAAKPAGAAIAPAKQHQSRSLLIKVGAFLAAGAAGGIVYALSRGTSSTPPGATSPTATRK